MHTPLGAPAGKAPPPAYHRKQAPQATDRKHLTASSPHPSHPPPLCSASARRMLDDTTGDDTSDDTSDVTSTAALQQIAIGGDCGARNPSFFAKCCDAKVRRPQCKGGANWAGRQPGLCTPVCPCRVDCWAALARTSLSPPPAYLHPRPAEHAGHGRPDVPPPRRHRLRLPAALRVPALLCAHARLVVPQAQAPRLLVHL